ncbi:hypothetical protein [Mesorhizobium sp. WSM4887]|uniref:hypothetical protein n=1 Tax=Mesorhizobium sp. WSM4887 TaxID=3038543 RepID=UPI0024176A2B|nr:hypothetical protein [Mesorhizobium sp. WSM4887]MDG4889282.1 hypothetical protein [Mesorhizobium sp. WSM4887]
MKGEVQRDKKRLETSIYIAFGRFAESFQRAPSEREQLMMIEALTAHIIHGKTDYKVSMQ